MHTNVGWFHLVRLGVLSLMGWTIGVAPAAASADAKIFGSTVKGWAGPCVTGQLRWHPPVPADEPTSRWPARLPMDCFTSQYFIPFSVVTGYTILRDGEHQLRGVGMHSEMRDPIPLGRAAAPGILIPNRGGGFRSGRRLCHDFGVVCGARVIDPVIIFQPPGTRNGIWSG